MTGPEHYREAERLIAMDDLHEPPTRGNIELAQVHATLALAAATAGLDAVEGPNGGSATGRTTEDWHGWHVVLGGRATAGDGQ